MCSRNTLHQGSVSENGLERRSWLPPPGRREPRGWRGRQDLKSTLQGLGEVTLLLCWKASLRRTAWSSCSWPVSGRFRSQCRPGPCLLFPATGNDMHCFSKGGANVSCVASSGGPVCGAGGWCRPQRAARSIQQGRAEQVGRTSHLDVHAQHFQGRGPEGGFQLCHHPAKLLGGPWLMLSTGFPLRLMRGLWVPVFSGEVGLIGTQCSGDSECRVSYPGLRKPMGGRQAVT